MKVESTQNKKLPYIMIGAFIFLTAAIIVYFIIINKKDEPIKEEQPPIIDNSHGNNNDDEIPVDSIRPGDNNENSNKTIYLYKLNLCDDNNTVCEKNKYEASFEIDYLSNQHYKGSNVYKYECEIVNCNFAVSSTSLLIYDDNNIFTVDANNFATKTIKSKVNKNIDYLYYVVDDTGQIGYTINDEFYSMDNKLLYKANERIENIYSTFGNNSVAIFTDNYNTHIVDYTTGNLIFKKTEDDTEFVTGTVTAIKLDDKYYYGIDDSDNGTMISYVYDTKGNKKLEIAEYTVIDNKLYTYVFNSSIKIYDKNLNMVSEIAKNIKVVNMSKDYFVGIDNNNVNVYDINENLIKTIATISGNMEYDMYMSGMDEENIYIELDEDDVYHCYTFNTKTKEVKYNKSDEPGDYK